MPGNSSTPPNRQARRHTSDAKPQGRRWASAKETGEYLSLTTRTIWTMIDDGRLRAYRNGKKLVRLDLNEVDAAMTPLGGASE
ncbi:excisionase family DNA-binding protein [Mycobacterium sp. M23085]|uniref:excisionase family DNA-binding protein n=1 Tax=Mycobacterium sp. M23085 TaxID=3378087 RepID=UPI003877D0FE